MIIDSLSNSDKYVSLHPRFAKAFEFIKSQNLETIAAGKYPIDGPELHAGVTERDGYSRKKQSLNAIITGWTYRFAQQEKNKWDGAQEKEFLRQKENTMQKRM